MSPDVADIVQRGGATAVAILALAAVAVLWRSYSESQKLRIDELKSALEAMAAHRELVEAVEKLLDKVQEMRR